MGKAVIQISICCCQLSVATEGLIERGNCRVFKLEGVAHHAKLVAAIALRIWTGAAQQGGISAEDSCKFWAITLGRIKPDHARDITREGHCHRL